MTINCRFDDMDVDAASLWDEKTLNDIRDNGYAVLDDFHGLDVLEEIKYLKEVGAFRLAKLGTTGEVWENSSFRGDHLLWLNNIFDEDFEYCEYTNRLRELITMVKDKFNELDNIIGYKPKEHMQVLLL